MQCILVGFQLLLVNPTQNVDHVAIDMRTVAQVNGCGVTRNSLIQLWLNVVWICWAWVCDTARQALRWSRRNADALRWLVPTRISLYIVPFLVTWRPREVLRGSGQQRSCPIRPANRAPHAQRMRIPVRPGRHALTRLLRSTGATVSGTESGTVGI